MAKQIQLVAELNRLNEQEQTVAIANRTKAINAKIELRNMEIDELISLGHQARRCVLEKKSSEWIKTSLEVHRRIAARNQQRRMRGNASNARTQLKNFGM